MNDPCTLSATALRAALQRRELAAVEVTRAVLERIAAIAPLGAFVTVDADGALKAAASAQARIDAGDDGPLLGVPISVKDLVSTGGLRTTCGSRTLTGWVPPDDAAAVARVRAAGAVIVGKTATCEFGHKLTGDSELVGLCRNPWDPTRTAGGSSGGAAVALATGAGPLAIGTDAVGSIRVPASFCGVVGLKPTYGRVPRAPGFAPPSWDSLAHTGPMARTVADVALLFDAIAGEDDRDRMSLAAPAGTLAGAAYGAIDVAGLRLGFAPTLGAAPVDPEVAGTVAAAVDALTGVVREVTVVAPDFGDAHAVIRTIGLSELAASRAGDDVATRAQLDATLRRVLAGAPAASAVDYVRASHARNTMAAELRRLFTQIDLLVLPTVAVAAFTAGTIGVDEVAGTPVDPHLGWSPFTYPFNLTGFPAATVPCGRTARGLPIGLQIAGPRFAEARILALAAACESLMPWPEIAPLPRTV